MEPDTQFASVGREPAVPGKPVVDPADWSGDEFGQRDDWLYLLSDSEIADLRDMGSRVKQKIGADLDGLLDTSAEDYDLGAFTDTLSSVRNNLKDGTGAVLIRGLPLDDMTLDDAAIIYWGIGRHLGRAVSNSPEGDMFSQIVDKGKDYDDADVRGYQTNATMDYHSDQCDIVTLLCIHTAKSGGMSKVVSSVAVYNELLKRRPELVEVLCQPYCWTKHAETDPDEAPYYTSPVFSFLDGYFCASFGPKHMEKGHALAAAPDMTDIQLEAMRFTEQLCEELHFEAMLQRGDFEFANNSVVLHTRNGFEDWPEPERKRRLWRFWIHAPDIRPPTDYIKQWRNGVQVKGMRERVNIEL